jgi:acyl-homoserine lactone acylase PvdQ
LHFDVSTLDLQSLRATTACVSKLSAKINNGHENLMTRILNLSILLVFLLLTSCSQETEQTAASATDKLATRAQNITIIRDDFGVPHIYAKTDADAVFGLLYAQAEDDFNRIERNYVWAIGRLAEIEGEKAMRARPTG